MGLVKNPLDFCAPLAYNMSMTFIETTVFTHQVTEYLSDDEYAEMQRYLADNPGKGVLVPGGGGVRKIRWSGSGRGKRGGTRTLYFWDSGECIYMLFMFKKNERSDISKEQLQLLREAIKEGGLK